MDCQQPKRRLPVKRRRQRGVALVETAFILPMFVLLWWGSRYMHDLGSTHVKVNSTARAKAWALAMANCNVHLDEETEKLPNAAGSGSGLAGSGSGGSANAVSTALKNGNAAGALSGFVNTFTSLISGAFPNPSGSTDNETLTVSWRSPDLYDHSGMTPQTTIVKGTLTVVCNEAPQNGSISAAISGVVGFIKGML